MKGCISGIWLCLHILELGKMLTAFSLTANGPGPNKHDLCLSTPQFQQLRRVHNAWLTTQVVVQQTGEDASDASKQHRYVVYRHTAVVESSDSEENEI